MDMRDDLIPPIRRFDQLLRQTVPRGRLNDILDQLPISRDKSITIEHSDLAKAVLNETTGELKWDCELKPKQTEVIKYAYKITWPKDKNIRETAY